MKRAREDGAGGGEVRQQEGRLAVVAGERDNMRDDVLRDRRAVTRRQRVVHDRRYDPVARPMVLLLGVVRRQERLLVAAHGHRLGHVHRSLRVGSRSRADARYLAERRCGRHHLDTLVGELVQGAGVEGLSDALRRCLGARRLHASRAIAAVTRWVCK